MLGIVETSFWKFLYNAFSLSFIISLISGFAGALGLAFLADFITSNNNIIDTTHHKTFPSLTALETVIGAEFGVSKTILAFAISGASI